MVAKSAATSAACGVTSTARVAAAGTGRDRDRGDRPDRGDRDREPFLRG